MSKVIADLEVGLAVDFLLNLAPSRETAEQSIAAAQEHLRDTVEGFPRFAGAGVSTERPRKLPSAGTATPDGFTDL